MIGGFTVFPWLVSIGPGRPMPMPARSSVPRPACREQLWCPSDTTRSSTASGPSATSWPSRRSASTVPFEVRDGNVHVGGADVDRQHHAGGGVEGKARRRPAAAGTGLACRPYESGLHQCVNAGRDGGPRQAGGQGQFGAGAGLAVAQQLEQVPSTGHAARCLGGGGVGAGRRSHESVIARALLRVTL